jgi:hypothetical protein
MPGALKGCADGETNGSAFLAWTAALDIDILQRFQIIGSEYRCDAGNSGDV